MLSRTAENLYWASRYMERAESTARLIEMGQRMAMLPGSIDRDEWRSVVAASGAAGLFEPEERISEAAAIRVLLTDQENPSSIHSCMTKARANAKAVRTALTQEMWEALNDGWRRLETVEDGYGLRRELPVILDWVKSRAALFRGAAETQMLRNDGYDFLRLGGFMERADMALRLLDVKYWVLLPETEVVGGGRDHHQWSSVLYATSAIRAYHHVYKGDYAPWKIADFLILNRAFPRSLAHCCEGAGRHLDRLAARYGQRHDCHDEAAAMIAMLDGVGMGEIFQVGLHEFITDAIARNNRLAAGIARAFHF